MKKTLILVALAMLVSRANAGLTNTNTIATFKVVSNYFQTNMVALSNNLVTSISLIDSNADSIYNSYGSLAMGTGTVNVGWTTPKFSSYSYSSADGAIGVETNSSIVVSNAGVYQISFGSDISGQNGNTLYLRLMTNDVLCSIQQLGFSPVTGQLSETGFKMFSITLPANCRIALCPTNVNNADVGVQNINLNVHRVR